MINSQISAALATQLATLDLPTQWENAKFTPEHGITYLAESLIPGSTIAVGIASAASDEFGGVYQVLVYAPLDYGKGHARLVADQVAGAFQRGDRLIYDGVTVTILQTTQNASFKSGERWCIPVSVTYRAFA
jgi:hypothetical protein